MGQILMRSLNICCGEIATVVQLGRGNRRGFEEAPCRRARRSEGTQTLRGSLGVAGAWLGARRSGRAVQEIASVVQLGRGNRRGREARGFGGVNVGGPDVWRVVRQRLGAHNAS